MPTGTAARTSDRGRPRGVLYMGVPRGALVERDVGEGCRADAAVCKKSAAPAGLRTCVELRWCGTRSVAVGLHQVLGVGELVEMIDVSLGNHDVDGREHEETPCGNVLCIDSLLDEAEDHPVYNEECANAGSVGATLRFKQEKRRTSLAAMSGA